MTNEHVYFTKGKHAGHLLEVSAQEAQDAKANGEGHIADMSEYNKYKQRADVALNNYKALERKLKTSDDPRLGTKEMREYELAEKWAELSEEIATIDEEWSAKKSEIAETARQAAATHSISVSTQDKQLGEQFANRYAMQLASKQSKEGQEAVLNAMQSEIERLSDSQRVALQPHLLSLNSIVKDDVSTREVFTTAAQMQAPEAVALKAVEAYPWRVTTEFHTLRTVREHMRKGGRIGE